MNNMHQKSVSNEYSEATAKLHESSVSETVTFFSICKYFQEVHRTIAQWEGSARQRPHLLSPKFLIGLP
jgi:hypothetical protein